MELQDQYSDLMNKYSNNEKARLRLQNQVDIMSVDLEKVSFFFNQKFSLFYSKLWFK